MWILDQLEEMCKKANIVFSTYLETYLLKNIYKIINITCHNSEYFDYRHWEQLASSALLAKKTFLKTRVQ